MIKELMNYGGIAGKIHAMYGGRLTSSNYNDLLSLHTVPEIAAYLKGLPAWADALRDMNVTGTRRRELEVRLQNALYSEYIRIYKFMTGDDRPLMSYMVTSAEISQILSFFSALIVGRPRDYACTLPEFFLEHSRVYFSQFESADSFDGLLQALSGTPYHDILARLPRGEEGLPDYGRANAAFLTHYYVELLAVIRKRYGGKDRKALLEMVLGQIDLLNVEVVMRIKQYFPAMREDMFSHLIPLKGALRGSFFTELMEAETREAAFSLLYDTAYAGLFEGYRFDDFANYRYTYVHQVSKRLIASPTPGPFTPVAYLNLKELELKNLTAIVECVRYGVSLEDAGYTLIGV